jgi:tripartite-type tricarboxylate transporter receptor subunit TctC
MLLVSLICLSVTAASFGASKNSWPKRPIQIIVGANPGGGIDTAARLMGKYLEKELGQVIVVSNMAGGAGSVAARQVKASNPDGYTMLVCHEALLSNKIAGTTEFDYDGFEAGGIALKVYTTCLLSKKYTDFDKLVQAAKEHPGKVRFGTEIATNDTAIIAMIENKMNLKFQIIDSGAVSDQIASMMGDHIDFMKAPVGLVKDYVTAGQFHILGFFNESRNPDYPKIPTMKQLGIDFVVDKFFFCAFPPKTDKAIINKFAAALKKVSKNPAFVKEANKIDYTVSYVAPVNCPSYFEHCKVRLVEYQKLIDKR